MSSKEERKVNEEIVALESANSIKEECGLGERSGIPEYPDTINKLGDYTKERWPDTKIVLASSPLDFTRIVNRLNPENINHKGGSQDRTGGHGLRTVWFVTPDKVRVLTIMNPDEIKEIKK